MFSRISVLCALLCLLPRTQGNLSYPHTFLGITDPSNYMWYDGTEECKNSTLPCFTTLKHCNKAVEGSCSSSAKESDMSWRRYGFDLWAATAHGPLPVLGGLDWTVLKWTNTNPKYPTVITWKPGREVDVNYFTMYREIPAGETQWNMSLTDLVWDMSATSYLPANASKNEQWGYGDPDFDLQSQLFRSASRAYPVFFTIGQPDDPKYGKFQDENLGGKMVNETDSTSGFLYPGWLGFDLSEGQESARDYVKYQSKRINKRWAIGVGVGVGLGVPVLMVLMYKLGKRSALKSTPAKQADAEESK